MVVRDSDVPYPCIRNNLILPGAIRLRRKSARVRLAQAIVTSQWFRIGMDGGCSPGTVGEGCCRAEDTWPTSPVAQR